MPFNITFDYRFDSIGFFNDPARRAALEEAGRIWSSILKDELEDVPAGLSFTIRNPENGVSLETVTLSKPIDDLRIFVGARVMAGGQLAEAGPTGFSLKGDAYDARISGNFRGNGPVTDFEPWAGTMTFNTVANWNYDLSGPQAGKSDFLSVALHEMGHIFGIGTSGAFTALNEGSVFKGANALRVTGGQGVPLDSTEHVKDGYRGDSILMDPTLSDGRRILPTEIDKAILADIGWEIDGFSKEGSQPAIATNNRDVIFGTDGADTINGLGGDDQIQAEAGDDVLIGGPGADVLFGEAGRDVFVFGLGDGHDVIADFDFSNEAIRFVDSGFQTVAEVLNAVSRPFSDVLRITLKDGSKIDIYGVSSSDNLTAKNIELQTGSVYVTPNDDVITFGDGDQTIDALGGFDTAIEKGAISGMSIKITKTGEVQVTDRNGAGGTDRLIGFEKLQFDDQTLDLTNFDKAATLSSAQFTELTEMYVAYFNRAPDTVGLYFWADKLAEGATMNQIAELFFDQAETRKLYPNPSDTDAFVTSVYSNVLGRTPDAGGYAFWVNELNTNAVTPGAFVRAIINGAKNGGGAWDTQYLSSKTNLGIYFAAIKGMSEGSDGIEAMNTFGDQATSNLAGAKAVIDGHYADAIASGGGDFLFTLVGVVDDPFA